MTRQTPLAAAYFLFWLLVICERIRISSLATNDSKMSSVSPWIFLQTCRTFQLVRIIIIILEFIFDWRWIDGASGYCVFYLIWNIHSSGVAYVYRTNRMNNYWIYRCKIVKIFKGTNSQMPLSMNTFNILQWHCLR